MNPNKWSRCEAINRCMKGHTDTLLDPWSEAAFSQGKKEPINVLIKKVDNIIVKTNTTRFVSRG